LPKRSFSNKSKTLGLEMAKIEGGIDPMN